MDRSRRGFPLVRDSVQALPRPAVAPVRVVEAEESDVADLVSVRSCFRIFEEEREFMLKE